MTLHDQFVEVIALLSIEAAEPEIVEDDKIRRQIASEDLVVRPPSLPVHVQFSEVLRIEAQLDPSTNQRLIDAVAITSERDRGSVRHSPHDRPAERLAQQGWFDGVQRAMAGEALDWRLTGFGVHAGVAHLLRPRRKAVIELLEAGDALGFGLEQEALADVAVEPLLLAAPGRRVGTAVDEANAQHGAAALQRRI